MNRSFCIFSNIVSVQRYFKAPSPMLVSGVECDKLVKLYFNTSKTSLFLIFYRFPQLKWIHQM